MGPALPRMLLTILVVCLALAGAQTTPLPFGVPTTVGMPSCSWRHFTVTVPAKYGQITTTLSNVTALTSGEVINFYMRRGSTGSTFLEYDSISTMSSPTVLSLPTLCAANAGDTFTYSVYNGLTHDVFLELNATTYTLYTMGASYPLSNGAVQSFLAYPGLDYSLTFSPPTPLPATGFLGVSVWTNESMLPVLLSDSFTVPRLCGSYVLGAAAPQSSRLIGSITTGTVAGAAPTFISYCDWAASGGPYNFALSVSNTPAVEATGLPVQIFINATIYYAHDVTTAPLSNTVANQIDYAYHSFNVPAGTQQLAVYVNGVENLGSNQFSLNKYSPALESVGYPTSIPSYFTQHYGSCNGTDITLASFGDNIKGYGFQGCDITPGTWYISATGTANMNMYATLPFSYTITVVADAGTPTPLTLGTPTPATLTYGKLYSHFSVAIAQTDIDANSVLTVTVYADGLQSLGAAAAVTNLGVYVSGYGLAGDGSDYPADGGCGTFHRMCIAYANSDNYCTVTIEPCFLTVGTWYIAVKNLDQFGFTAGWEAQDINFSILAALETPTALTNGTVMHSSVATGASKQFSFAVNRDAFGQPGYLQFVLYQTTGTDTLNLAVQFGLLAGDSSVSLCGSMLETQQLNIYGSSYSETLILPAFTAPPYGSISGNTFTVSCPIQTGTYYINVRGNSMGNAYVPFFLSASHLAGVANPTPVPAVAPETPVMGDTLATSTFYFNATGYAGTGNSLRFSVESVSMTSTGVRQLIATVYNTTETCLEPLYTSTCMAVQNAMGSQSQSNLCEIVVPACLVQSTFYYIVVKTASATDPPVKFRLNAHVDGGAVALTINTPLVARARSLAPSFTQFFSVAIPAPFPPLDTLTVELYSTVQTLEFTAYLDFNALPGVPSIVNDLGATDPMCAATPLRRAQVVCTGASSAECRAQLHACQIPAGVMYIGVSVAAAIGTDPDMPLYTIAVRQTSPQPMVLGVMRQDTVFASAATHMYHHYTVVAPTTILDGTTLEFMLTGATGNADLFVTNDVDRPASLAGASFWNNFASLLDTTTTCQSTYPDYAFAHCAAASDACMVSIPAAQIHPGANYHFSVVSAGNAPVAYKLVANNVSAPTLALSDGVPMVGQVGQWGYAAYALTTTADRTNHVDVSLTALSDYSKVVVYANWGGAASRTTWQAVCSTMTATSGTAATCTVQVDNCGGSTVLKLAVYVVNDGAAAETIVPFQIMATVRVPQPLTANTLYFNTLTTTALNYGGVTTGAPLLHYTFTLPAYPSMSSFDFNVTQRDGTLPNVQVYYSFSGPAGPTVGTGNIGGRCLSSEVTPTTITGSQVVSPLTPGAAPCNVFSLPTTIYFAIGASGVGNASLLVTIQNVRTPQLVAANGVLSITNDQVYILKYTVSPSMPVGSVVTLAITGVNSGNIIWQAWRNTTYCAGPVGVVPDGSFKYVTDFGTGANPQPSQCEVALGDSVFYAMFYTSTPAITVTGNVAFTATPPTTLSPGATVSGSMIGGQMGVFMIPAQTLSDTQFLTLDVDSANAFTAVVHNLQPCGNTLATINMGNSSWATQNFASQGLISPCTMTANPLYVVLTVSGAAFGGYSIAFSVRSATTAPALASGAAATFVVSGSSYAHVFPTPADTSLQLHLYDFNSSVNYLLVNRAAGLCSPGVASSNTTIHSHNTATYCPPVNMASTYTLIVYDSSAADAQYTLGAVYAAPIALTLNPASPLAASIPAGFTTAQFTLPASAAANALFNVLVTDLTNVLGFNSLHSFIEADYESPSASACTSQASTDYFGTQSGTRYHAQVTCRAARTQYFITVSLASAQPYPVTFNIGAYANAVMDLSPSVPVAITNTFQLTNLFHLIPPTGAYQAPPVGSVVTLTVGNVTCGALTVSAGRMMGATMGTACADMTDLAATTDEVSATNTFTHVITLCGSLVAGNDLVVQIDAAGPLVDQTVSYTLMATWSYPIVEQLTLDVPFTQVNSGFNYYWLDTGALPDGASVIFEWTGSNNFEINYAHLNVPCGMADLTGDDYSYTRSYNDRSFTKRRIVNPALQGALNTKYYVQTNGVGILRAAEARATAVSPLDYSLSYYVYPQTGIVGYTNQDTFYPLHAHLPTQLVDGVPQNSRVEAGQIQQFGFDFTGDTATWFSVHVSDLITPDVRIGIEGEVAMGDNYLSFEGGVEYADQSAAYSNPAEIHTQSMLNNPFKFEAFLTFAMNEPYHHYVVNVYNMNGASTPFTISMNVVPLPSLITPLSATPSPRLTPLVPTATAPAAVEDWVRGGDARFYYVAMPALAAGQMLRLDVNSLGDGNLQVYILADGEQYKTCNTAMMKACGTVITSATNFTTLSIVVIGRLGAIYTAVPNNFRVNAEIYTAPVIQLTSGQPMTASLGSGYGGTANIQSPPLATSAAYLAPLYFSLLVPTNASLMTVTVSLTNMANTADIQIGYNYLPAVNNGLYGNVMTATTDMTGSRTMQMTCVTAGTYYIQVALVTTLGQLINVADAVTITANYIVMGEVALAVGTPVTGRTVAYKDTHNNVQSTVVSAQPFVYRLDVPATTTLASYEVTLNGVNVMLYSSYYIPYDSAGTTCFGSTYSTDTTSSASPMANYLIPYTNGGFSVYFSVVGRTTEQEHGYTLSVTTVSLEPVASAIPLTIGQATPFTISSVIGMVTFSVTVNPATQTGSTLYPIISTPYAGLESKICTDLPAGMGCPVDDAPYICGTHTTYYITVYAYGSSPPASNFTATITAMLATPVAINGPVTQTVTVPWGSVLLYSVNTAVAATLYFTPGANSTQPVSIQEYAYDTCSPFYYANPAMYYESYAGSPFAIQRTVRAMHTAGEATHYYRIFVPSVRLDGSLPDPFSSLVTWDGTQASYTFTLTATVAAGVAADATGGFCGAMGISMSYYENATSRDASAHAVFESMYRSIACQPAQVQSNPYSMVMCQPLTAACNASLQAYACETKYREADPNGFALDLCSYFCQNVLTSCSPFFPPGRYQYGEVAGGRNSFQMGWCADSAATMCSGFMMTAPPPPPPVDQAIVDNGPPVGLIVGLTVGLFVLFVLIGVGAAIYLKRRRNTGGSSKSVPMKTVSSSSTSVSSPPPSSTPAPAADPRPVSTRPAPAPAATPAPATTVAQNPMAQPFDSAFDPA